MCHHFFTEFGICVIEVQNRFLLETAQSVLINLVFVNFFQVNQRAATLFYSYLQFKSKAFHKSGTNTLTPLFAELVFCGGCYYVEITKMVILCGDFSMWKLLKWP